MKPEEFFQYRKAWIDEFNNQKEFTWYKREQDPKFLIDDPNWLPYSNELGTLSEWIKIDHCWLRTVYHGDPNKIIDRRVFIEKTPRIYDPSFKSSPYDWRAWISGYKGEADNGEGPDLESIKWADEFAKFIGYGI